MAASSRLETLPVANTVKPLTLEKTKDLVFQLGVPLNDLDDIEAGFDGEDRKVHFVQQWLDGDLGASWEKLVSGLERINMRVLAAEIKAKFVHDPLIPAPLSAPPSASLPTQPFTISPKSPLEAVAETPAAEVPTISSAPGDSVTTPAPNISSPHLPTSTLPPAPSLNEVTQSHSASNTLSAPQTFSADISSLPSDSTTDPTTTFQPVDTKAALSPAPSPNKALPPQPLSTAAPVSVALTPNPAPITLATPTQSESVNKEMVAYVRARIERFEDEFSDLFVDAQLSWSEREERERSFLKRFRAHLLALPVSKKASHIKFFKQNRREILKAENIEAIAAVLSNYSNYANYEIILHLVRKFCEEVLKTRMLSYRDSFEEFEMATTIDVYLSAISARPESEIRAGFIRMAMRINKPASACTLHEIRQLRESIAKSAALESYSMYIENPGEGSVIAAFHVPAHCSWLVARAITPEFKQTHSLSDVTLAGQDITYWDSSSRTFTWTSRASEEIMQEYVTCGDDGQYLPVRDYDTYDCIASSGETGFHYICARDLTTGKSFVIKSTAYDSMEKMERLERESETLLRIPSHKNIVTFIGAMQEEVPSEDGVSQRSLLLMELAEHGSLASVMKSAEAEEMGSTIGLEQSLFYLYQILQAVSHLHSLHILHLNINSKNVLVLEDGRRVKLTNFTSALYIRDISKFKMPDLSEVSPHFSAPEVIRGDVLSFSSDVWSSVCVFIHLLTGKLPGHHAGLTSGESMREMLMKYSDLDIQQLIPLSEMVLDKDVVRILRDTLHGNTLSSRPTALDLLECPALKNAHTYELRFYALEHERKETEAESQTVFPPHSSSGEYTTTREPTIEGGSRGRGTVQRVYRMPFELLSRTQDDDDSAVLPVYHASGASVHYRAGAGRDPRSHPHQEPALIRPQQPPTPGPYRHPQSAIRRKTPSPLTPHSMSSHTSPTDHKHSSSVEEEVAALPGGPPQGDTAADHKETEEQESSSDTMETLL